MGSDALNVTETALYGHAGAYDDLEVVVKHHLSPSIAIDQFDFENNKFLELVILMDSAEKWTRDALKHYKKSTSSSNGERVFSNTEIEDIVSVIEHLTDPF